MSASPFTSELKVILAMTVILIGIAFASMVPKQGCQEVPAALNGVLTTEGGVSGLDGNGTFGFLPQKKEAHFAAQQVRSILFGCNRISCGENNDIAVYSGPGAKQAPFNIKPIVPDQEAQESEIPTYGDFWSGRFHKKQTLADTPVDSPDGNSENADSDDLMAQAQRNDKKKSASGKPDQPDTFSDQPNEGFTQEDLLSDRQKGPVQPRWKEEVAVPEVEMPEMAQTDMPEWNDSVSLPESIEEPASTDPLAEEARKAEEEGLLAETETKPASPSELPNTEISAAADAAKNSTAASAQPSTQPAEPLAEKSDSLLDDPTASTTVAAKPDQSVQNLPAAVLSPPKTDSVRTAEYNQPQNSGENAIQPVNILIPEDESKYADRTTGVLVVSPKNQTENLLAAASPKEQCITAQKPQTASSNSIQPPQPVSTLIADGSQTLEGLPEQLKLIGKDRDYFLALNREKARTDGSFPPGTVIRVPIISKSN